MQTVHPFNNEWPVKYCNLCLPKKKLAGPHFLAHLRFCHPVQWENYHFNRGDFGMSGFLHVAAHLMNATETEA